MFHYNSQTVIGGVVAAVYSIVLYVFLSGLLPIEVLTFLQSTTIPILTTSRVSVCSVSSYAVKPKLSNFKVLTVVRIS